MPKSAYTSRYFLKMVGLSGEGLIMTHTLDSAEAREKQLPNIIYIVADDLGYGDVSCYNPDSKIPTPHIDALTNAGMRFTDAHSPATVCTPTHYGVLTGRYCWRTWLKRDVLEGDGTPLIEPERLTIASLLKQHGYRSACIGKWHLGLGLAFLKGKQPLQNTHWKTGYWRHIDFTKPFTGGPKELGFDYFFDTPACPTDDCLWCYVENDRVIGVPQSRDDRMEIPGWRHEEVDTTFTEKSIKFIEDHCRDKHDKPFFLYLALSVPHAPWLPPEFVKGKSKVGPRGDQVVLADWCVQQIRETIDRLKISDNTLVIFTSDNGPRIGANGHKSAGKLRGYKSHIWEGGHREPFIACWPGKIEPGTVSSEPIELTDMIATVAAIVGHDLPPNADEDSYNILPTLLGKNNKPVRNALVHHSCFGTFSIRRGKWKLILGTKDSGGWVEPRDKAPEESFPGQLYDIVEDPYETKDLWNEYPKVVQKLIALLDEYRNSGRSRPLR